MDVYKIGPWSVLGTYVNWMKNEIVIGWNLVHWLTSPKFEETPVEFCE